MSLEGVAMGVILWAVLDAIVTVLFVGKRIEITAPTAVLVVIIRIGVVLVALEVLRA